MPAAKHFVVIAYDLSHDRRRTKLHKLLLDYGTPVQFSLFECWLTQKEIEQLQARIRKLIRPKDDHVRVYMLCNTCAAKATTTTAGELTQPAGPIIV